MAKHNGQIPEKVILSDWTTDVDEDCSIVRSDLSKSSMTNVILELEDLFFRGRNAIFVQDPHTKLNVNPFQSHVKVIAGLHAFNGPICKNVQIGPSQVVHWNPD
jgi:hypothetical protein